MSTSPDGIHTADLDYAGEIPFGPAYYSLIVDGTKIKDRIFGDRVTWSDNSRYLAAEEWLSTSSKEGPITRVVLFDMANSNLSEFNPINKGFACDFVFSKNILIYRKHYFGKGIISEVEVDIDSIKNWKSINL
ncbi:MAG: hypothetical protein OEV28_05340 [Nitrospirota bacterium]|nr:hypothetical protein [Nitrospirota bacterium]